MPTLVLKQVPDDLYRRLQQAALSHRRSLTAEALAALRSGLDEPCEQDPKPGVEAILTWLKAEVWCLPVQDRRSDDEILGHNADGLFD